MRSGAGETVRMYTYGNYIDEPITMTTSGAGRSGTFYYHTNNLYNVRALTDEDGDVVERYQYSAYGEPTILDPDGTERGKSVVGNQYMFQGRRMDTETGLYYYRNRYYSAQLGRFVTRDPMGYVDGYNLYQYVGGNPGVRVDPRGLEGKYCCKQWEPRWNVSYTSVDECVRSIVPSYWQDDVTTVTASGWSSGKDWWKGMGRVTGVSGISEGVQTWGPAAVETGARIGATKTALKATNLLRYSEQSALASHRAASRGGMYALSAQSRVLSKVKTGAGAVGTGVTVWTGGEWLTSRLAILIAYKTCNREVCTKAVPAELKSSRRYVWETRWGWELYSWTCKTYHCPGGGQMVDSRYATRSPR